MVRMKNSQLICVSGMPGSGKSFVSDELVKKGYLYVRFGQIVLDEIIKRNLSPTEENERKIREDIRAKFGMGAMAILNLSKIESLLEKGNVVGDGLYSFAEYKILKEKFGNRLVVIAVYAPPKLRYKRISKRILTKNDKDLRNRPLSSEKARARDYAEIENIEKAGPIAMADYTLLNTKDISFLLSQFTEILNKIEKG